MFATEFSVGTGTLRFLMPSIPLDQLDDYSRIAVPIILATFPEWESLAVVKDGPDGEGATVEFEIACPSPNVEHGLWVLTADEELTVGFHTHHVHFTNYDERIDERQIANGVQFAADIVSEHLGVVSRYSGGRLQASCSVPLPKNGSVASVLETIDSDSSLLTGFYTEGERFTVRSWNGRFDCDRSGKS